METLTLLRPDDWHLHLRDGAMLRTVLPHTAARFGRALVMPNLKPPVATVAEASAYRARILEALPAGARFTPLMTLYLTEQTTPEEIDRAAECGFIPAVKLYPAGATTNSAAGVSALERTFAVLERMAERNLVLCVHGESTDPAADIFDREHLFVEQTLAPLMQRFPTLRIVLEHITTRQAAEFVRAAPDTLAATITPQHLLLNRNAIFHGGVRPHHYCLPVLKREEHRRALLEAATSAHPRFFLGTDSAPHARATKEAACGCAGCYSAHAAIELYAQAFASVGALDRLEAFASRNGAAFYGLPPNGDTITLVRRAHTVPESFPLAEGGDTLVGLFAGETIEWQMLLQGESA